MNQLKQDELYQLITLNLYIGQIIKNYKEVCQLLNEPIKKGKSKILQQENWKRYFSWERKGHKYIITIIHEEPIPKTENNNIYSQYIEKLILDLLVQKYQSNNRNNRRLYLSKDQMLKALNIVNINYSFVKFNTGKTADFIKVDKETMKEFFNLNNKNLIDAVERTLKRLENKFLIIWHLVTTIALNEEVTIFDNGKEITLKENHITADPLTLEYINTYENKVAEEMGFNTKQEIFLSGRYQNFIKNVCYYLQEEEHLDIKYYYKSYDIIFHPNIIKERDKLNKYLLDYEERQNVKITLNGIVSNQLASNAEARHIEAKQQIEPVFGERMLTFADYNERKIIRRSQQKYLKDTDKIIDTVINPKMKDLTTSILIHNRLKRKMINNKKVKK